MSKRTKKKNRAWKPSKQNQILKENKQKSRVERTRTERKSPMWTDEASEKDELTGRPWSPFVSHWVCFTRACILSSRAFFDYRRRSGVSARPRAHCRRRRFPSIMHTLTHTSNLCTLTQTHAVSSAESIGRSPMCTRANDSFVKKAATPKKENYRIIMLIWIHWSSGYRDRCSADMCMCWHFQSTKMK